MHTYVVIRLDWDGRPAQSQSLTRSRPLMGTLGGYNGPEQPAQPDAMNSGRRRAASAYWQRRKARKAKNSTSNRSLGIRSIRICCAERRSREPN